MSHRLEGYIARCLDRSAEAARLACQEADPAAKAELQALANRWHRLAENYQYVQKLDFFLKTYTRTDQPSREL